MSVASCACGPVMLSPGMYSALGVGLVAVVAACCFVMAYCVSRWIGDK